MEFRVDLSTVIAIAVVAAVVLVVRVLWVFRSIYRDMANKRTKPIKTLVVLGSGGHTTEMLHLIQTLDPIRYTPLLYVVATTDSTSERRVEALGGRLPDTILKIPRSREVGQSYVSSVGTTLYSLAFAVILVLRIRPGLVLCNGPGTCLPIAMTALLFRILGLCEGKIVFVESFCRVTR